MKIIYILLGTLIIACQTQPHNNSVERKYFVFDTDTCNSLTTMDLHKIDCLALQFLKPMFISKLDTPYIMSKEIAFLNTIVDSTRRSMVSIEFVKRNFYQPSVTYFLKSRIISANQMSPTGSVNLHLYDSFYVGKDLNCGLLVYDRLNGKNEKYFYGNFLYQRPDSIVIDIEIAVRDSSKSNTINEVMCMLKSISFKDSTVLFPRKENDRFSRLSILATLATIE